MKKVVLIFSIMLISASVSFAFDFDFKFKESDSTTKTCKGYDEGYVCPNENPVYIEDFISIFMPHSMTHDFYIGNGQYKTCKQLKNGHYCKNELPVLYTSFLYTTLIDGIPIINKKGILIKSEDGTEKICKVDKNGYTCGNEKQYFNPILPFGTWKFYKSDRDKELNKTCTGYTNGYICPGKKPVYVENFRSHFDFKLIGGGYENFGESEIPTTSKISNGKTSKGILITDKNNKQKICKILDFDKYVQYGYVCKGETPVVLKNRPAITAYKNAENYNVYRRDILNDQLTQVTCKQKDGYYYCPGETKKSIPSNTNSYSKSNSQVQTPKYLEIPVGNGQYKKYRIDKGMGSDTIRLRKW